MQLSAIRLTANPVDVTAGLQDGAYLGQVRPASTVGLYATRQTAPSSTKDYFLLENGEFMSFCVSASAGPTWVRTLDPLVPGSLAIARL